jgi:hypothetical protein
MLYVTEMLRWGEQETHHYIVGVYSSKEGATFAGEIEKTWRGGKYDYQVVPMELDASAPDEQYQYHISCKGQ